MKKLSLRDSIRCVYFIGIQGVGMASLAMVVKDWGYEVIGSDIDKSFITTSALYKKHITVYKGFQKKHINKILSRYSKDEVLVVVTGAHKGLSNIEAQMAQNLGVQVVTHGQALGMFMRGYNGISVAGTHGKTTTTSMIAHILYMAKKDPSYVIGTGSISTLPFPGRGGKGKYFVAEADEYASDPLYDTTARFLYQKPFISLVTNIEYDHPDIYTSIDSLKKVFAKFIKNTSKDGYSIINQDNDYCIEIVKSIKKRYIRYGTSSKSDIQITNISSGTGKTSFNLRKDSSILCHVNLSVFGIHNIYNATAALIASYCAGISWNTASNLISQFKGSKRRMEYISTVKNIMLFDDYAHHPTEIKTTIQALKLHYSKKRIIVLFQPHTYSRTQALFNDFVTSFTDAFAVGVLPIFASAREQKDKNISSKKLVIEMSKYHPYSFYIRDIKDLEKNILPLMQQECILLTMGAGDIYQWHPSIIKLLKLKHDNSKKY